MDRKTGSVGTYDGTRRQDFFYLRIEIVLYVKSLYHGLDNPVNVGKFFQVVFDVANGDEFCRLLAIECGGTGLERALQSHTSDFIAVFCGIRRYDIEQQARDTHI